MNWEMRNVLLMVTFALISLEAFMVIRAQEFMPGLQKGLLWVIIPLFLLTLSLFIAWPRKKTLPKRREKHHQRQASTKLSAKNFFTGALSQHAYSYCFTIGLYVMSTVLALYVLRLFNVISIQGDFTLASWIILSWLMVFLLLRSLTDEAFAAQMKSYSMWIVLVMVVLITCSSATFIGGVGWHQQVRMTLLSVQMQLTVITTVFIIIAFFAGGGSKASLHKQQIMEKKDETKRSQEFDKKFRILAKFNFEYGITKNWKRRHYGVALARALLSPVVWIGRTPYALLRWMHKETWATSATIILILLTCGIFGLSYIGNISFAQDEMHFVWSAINLLQGEGPLTLTGDSYSLAFPTTYLTAASFSILGINEFSARVWNVVFYLLSLLLVYTIGKEIINTQTGLLAMFVTGFNTINFSDTLQLKPYAFLQFMFLLGIYLLIRFEQSNWDIKSPWFYLLILTILVGMRSHVGFSAFPAIALTYMAYSLLRRHGRAGESLWKGFQKKKFILIGSVIALYVAIFYERIFYNIAAALNYVTGSWGATATNSSDYLFYTSVFTDLYPMLVLLLIPSLALLILLYRKKGVLLSLFFLLPFLIHNFFILRKATRYVVYFLPVFVLISVALFGLLFFVIKRQTSTKRWARTLVLILLILLLGNILSPVQKTYAVVTDPYGTGGHSGILKTHYLWAEVKDYLSEHMEDDEPIISTEPILSTYYLPNPFYEIKVSETLDGALLNHTAAVTFIHHDKYTYQVIASLDTLQEVMERHESGWVIGYRHRFNDPTRVPPEITTHVRTTLKENTYVGGIEIYRWEH